MMNIIFLLALAAIAGCSSLPTPQNPNDFKSILGTSSLLRSDKETIHRPISEVRDSLSSVVNQCLNVTRTLSVNRGGTYGRSERDGLHAVLNNINPSFSQLSIQWKNLSGTNFDAPEKGFYVVVTDVNAISPNATELTFYYASTWSGTRKYVVEVASGKQEKCPN